MDMPVTKIPNIILNSKVLYEQFIITKPAFVFVLQKLSPHVHPGLFRNPEKDKY